MKHCLECSRNISYVLSKFSVEKYNIPLCLKHQYWIDDLENVTTFDPIRFYFTLKKRGIPAQIENHDRYNQLDIVIPDAKVKIEVDGKHHNNSKKQVLSDKKKNYFSFVKPYFTIRIPHSLVYNKYVVEETADFIIKILNESLNKQYLKNPENLVKTEG